MRRVDLNRRTAGRIIHREADHPMKTVDMMSFGDVRVFCSPLLPLAPKIGVRQICLKDGSPLLSPAFIERENRWWRAQFGEVEQAFQTADRIFMPPGMYDPTSFLDFRTLT